MIEEIDLLYPHGKLRGKFEKAPRDLPDSFLEDLGLRPLAVHLYPANAGYALNVLGKLSSDPEVIRYRQDILQDLLEFDGLGEEIVSNIKAMDDATYEIDLKHKNVESFYDMRIQIETMKNYIACITGCCTAIEGKDVRSDGLKRLCARIREIRDAEDFKKLREGVAYLDETFSHTVRSITVGINLDSFSRPGEMAILAVSDKPFVQKTMLSKLFGGGSEKGQAVEPVGTFYKRENGDIPGALEVGLFNDLKKQQDDLLRHFSGTLKNYYNIHTQFLNELLGELEFYLSFKAVVRAMQARGLPFCRPKIAPAEKRVFHARGLADLTLAYGLLHENAGAKLGRELVTNDADMDGDGRIFIVTGPNHGGKTTFTRAVGIAQVLFQAGLYIPGTEAEISPADWIFTHFQREEELGPDASRLTVECRQLKVTMEKATSQSLVLLNEAFSSTVYRESLAIASGTIRFLRKIGCRAVFTTHIVELAQNIDRLEAETPGDSRVVSLVAGTLGEDFKGGRGELNRSYKVERGLPRDQSYADEILQKYGLDFEAAIAGKK